MSLERSCGPEGTDWMRIAPSTDALFLSRIEARFAGHAYDPHRHDTYALGITRTGVQSFRYRGAQRNAVAGDVIILHPDEMHDGHSGSSTGFRYHMLYIDPGAISRALGRDVVPCIRGGISRDRRLAHAVSAVFDELNRPLEPLEAVDRLSDIASALNRVADGGERAVGSVDTGAVERAKAAMLDHIETGLPLETLEAVTGQSRFALTRHFRARHGVPPHRWLMARRLERVWSAVLDGASLAEASADAGFADQSHMSRQFRRRFGMSPGAWRTVVRNGRALGAIPSDRPRIP
ncbi:AraC family transcriptional regulator [Marivibrio halodurans]|uniref:AraC family transcriptional regulator n=1 Tax=Marivibrio halodurans TaxID=2039722 RepID=A0A8J7SLG7_9PROT|nr:AraC family transcriptional regulator [Marivibrio halodurans]MBP5859103.1 AraC family transcriptional regulator [Marivibrio halodurans]